MIKKLLKLSILLFSLLFVLSSCIFLFKTHVLNIEITPENSGIVEPNEGTFSKDSEIVLTVTPNEGWVFDKWEGEDASHLIPNTFNKWKLIMNEDKNLVALFREENRAPVLDSIGNKTVNEGTLISFVVTASDPDEDDLSFTAENLPIGSTFIDSTFSWTPSYDQAGNYEITFKVDDGVLTDQEIISISVVDINRAPVLDSIGNKTVNEGTLISFEIGRAHV